MDPQAPAHEPLRMRGPQWENHCSTLFLLKGQPRYNKTEWAFNPSSIYSLHNMMFIIVFIKMWLSLLLTLWDLLFLFWVDDTSPRAKCLKPSSTRVTTVTGTRGIKSQEQEDNRGLFCKTDAFIYSNKYIFPMKDEKQKERKKTRANQDEQIRTKWIKSVPNDLNFQHSSVQRV